MNGRGVRKALVVSTLAFLTLCACGVSAQGRTTSATPQPDTFLWGAWVGSQFTGQQPPWDWNAVTKFETRNTGGRHISALHWGVTEAWEHDFNYWRGAFNTARNAGVTSVVDMDTDAIPLDAIARGAKDTSLQRWATQAANWGHPFLLRFNWEMNGRWFPWGTTPSNQNTAADYVAAWRHVHDLFTAAGAKNIQWVWCPNIDPSGHRIGFDQLYPGDSYVDWTCLDGYNFGSPWSSFAKLYASSYDRILGIAPSKPMILGELASTERGGSKARWITRMFAALPTRFPQIQGLLWFDVYDRAHRRDWPIETSKTSSTAFKQGIAGTLARICSALTGSAYADCLGK